MAPTILQKKSGANSRPRNPAGQSGTGTMVPNGLGEDSELTVPFNRTEDIWFWFMQAMEARWSGARVTAGAGEVRRPCEPLDIMRILDRLYRMRKLKIDHVKILRHYGQRQISPDPRRPSEAKACLFWKEALEAFEPVLIRKGILVKLRSLEGSHEGDPGGAPGRGIRGGIGKQTEACE